MMIGRWRGGGDFFSPLKRNPLHFGYALASEVRLITPRAHAQRGVM